MSNLLMKMLVRLGKCEKNLLERELEITRMKLNFKEMEKKLAEKCDEIEIFKSKLSSEELCTSEDDDVAILREEVKRLKCKLLQNVEELVCAEQNGNGASYNDLLEGIEGIKKKVGEEKTSKHDESRPYGLNIEDVIYIRTIDQLNAHRGKYRKTISLQNDRNLFVWTVSLRKWDASKQESPYFSCHFGGFQWKLLLYEDLTLHLVPAMVWRPDVRETTFKMHIELVAEGRNKRKKVCMRPIQCLSIGGVLLCDLDAFEPEAMIVEDMLTIYVIWKCEHPSIYNSDSSEVTLTSGTDFEL